MRTIPEVVEDIKGILNNIERTEKCTGETLVDINELADEVLSINCYTDKPKTNGDKIRSMTDKQLAIFLKFFLNEFVTEEDIIDWIKSEAERINIMKGGTHPQDKEISVKYFKCQNCGFKYTLATDWKTVSEEEYCEIARCPCGEMMEEE